MKTIANLNGVDFLRAVNRTRHAAEKFVKTTDVLGIWKRMPVFNGDETDEQKHSMAREQVKKNLDTLLDTLLDAHADETLEFIMALCVMEEGEPEPDGIALIMVAFDLLSDNRVLDFLFKLGKSGLFVTEA